MFKLQNHSRSGWLSWRRLALGLVCTSALVLAGCASGPKADPRDPLEPLNRATWRFNEGLDKAILKPVAETYRDAVPHMVRAGVTNFFYNLTDLWSAVNSALQAKPEQALDNFFRFNLNTFFGLGGLIDVASDFNIERHWEDLGKTLGRWGVPSGPYLVIPLLGPSTVRDAAVRTLELQVDAVRYVPHTLPRNSLYITRIVNTRAQLLRAGEMMDEVALDRYSFMRDVYLQVRQRDVLGDKAGAAADSADPPPEEDYSKPAPSSGPSPAPAK